ncbi:hypothetical protein Agabi119p4_3071 [Agaricus bisporus var. burnettii]|uniref:Uncharacterized protein n=1 Tax=Agaricus bisporus var. burnettii TaxID=192524 RepID=A0A8H7F6G6_AGABI|nr:hypothetical protein Agabi119p4_3071 [Agaricus bisporus var. burnettii]
MSRPRGSPSTLAIISVAPEPCTQSDSGIIFTTDIRRLWLRIHDIRLDFTPLLPPPTALSRRPTTMCYRNLYLDRYKCTHSIFKQEQKVDCERPNCLLSAQHPINCSEGQLCRCQRYQDQPARYFRDMPRLCPKCVSGN